MIQRGRVARVEALVVAVPAEGNAFAEGEEETLLVRITDEKGLYGIGESVCTPAVVKAMIDQETIHFWSQGISDIVVGADPVETVALYDRIYHGSFYHGRRGTLIQALSAVDMALYDLAGKQLDLPIYKLLGGARSERVRPYATLYPGDIYDGPTDAILAETRRQAEIAIDQGLRAVKIPVLFGADMSDRQVVDFVSDCRAAVGDDIVMACDFGYRWWDWHDAAWTLRRLEDADRCGTTTSTATHVWQRCRPYALAAPNSLLAAGRCASGSSEAESRWFSPACRAPAASPNSCGSPRCARCTAPS